MDDFEVGPEAGGLSDGFASAAVGGPGFGGGGVAFAGFGREVAVCGGLVLWLSVKHALGLLVGPSAGGPCRVAGALSRPKMPSASRWAKQPWPLW
ncbi:hypothetical protein [Streptomyces sp. NPDC005017]|uniref:hypothetical protein n=1 Tax=Streptomyces sp. NPDC005017 TaxID=3364706 RepID=UPI0036C014B2